MRTAAVALLGAAITATAAAGFIAGSTPARQTPGILVSAVWLESRLDDPDVAIVHVEHRRDVYETGHIPGAAFLPYQAIAEEVAGIAVEMLPAERLLAALEAAGVVDGRHAVLYSTDPLSAARAWLVFEHLGLGPRASVLDGGLAAWRSAGGAVVSGPDTERRARTGRLTAGPRPALIVDADWVRRRLGRRGVALVDARPEAEFAGRRAGPAHGGHIPGAGSLYWKRMLSASDPPVLLPADRLRDLFEEAGVQPGDTVVAYCMIGMRASMTYLAARIAGLPAVLYDGSWQDWRRRGYPAER